MCPLAYIALPPFLFYPVPVPPFHISASCLCYQLLASAVSCLTPVFQYSYRCYPFVPFVLPRFLYFLILCLFLSFYILLKFSIISLLSLLCLLPCSSPNPLSSFLQISLPFIQTSCFLSPLLLFLEAFFQYQRSFPYSFHKTQRPPSCSHPYFSPLFLSSSTM